MIKTSQYKQTDYRWRWQTLGFGRPFVQTLGGYGCTVASLANMSSVLGKNWTPADFNNQLKQVSGFSNNAYVKEKVLVDWLAVEKLLPVKHVVRVRDRYSVNDDKIVKASIKSGMPVLIEFRHPSGFRHWCLAVGDSKIVDPLKGLVKFSTYPVSGYSLYKRK